MTSLRSGLIGVPQQSAGCRQRAQAGGEKAEERMRSPGCDPQPMQAGIRGRSAVVSGKLREVTETTQTWGVSGLARYVALAMTAVFGFGAVAVPIGGLVDGDPGVVLLTLVLGGVSATVALIVRLMGVRPCIRADATGLRIVNPFKEYTVPWGDIEHIAPGYSGLMIRRRTAGPVCAWAVQKSNYAAARNREVRADRIASELAELVAATSHTEHASTIVPSQSERIVLSRSARKTITAGLGSLVVVAALRLLLR